MATALVALGGNLGDRRANLDRAVRLLRAQPGLLLTSVSSYYETEPVGGPPGQPPYLNAAAAVETELAPEQLLERLFRIEQQLGRVRGEPNAPRTIDLDLLLYGDRVLSTPALTLPHPRLHRRDFVLVPLAEIAPDAVHPALGRTVRELRDALPPGPNPPRPFRPEPGEGTAHTPGNELAGLRAVVTGSTGGIGRATALELAAAGAAVLIHGRRAEAAREVVEEIRAAGGEADFRTADLRDPRGCGELAEAAWAWGGGIDVWVNNAGADVLTGEAARWPFERKWDELFAVDVAATVRLSRAIEARMKARGRGVILNVGWDQAETGMEGDSGQLFAASKAAVMAFTRSLALSLAPEVRVNCLAPGWVRTAWGDRAGAAWQERVERETPLRRWGLPEDVAAAVRWLAAPAAAFVTGQVIRVNGGAVRG